MKPMYPVTPFGIRWPRACAAKPISAKKPAACALSQLRFGETRATRAADATAAIAVPVTNRIVARCCIPERTPDFGSTPTDVLSQHERKQRNHDVRQSGQVRHLPLTKKSHPRSPKVCSERSAPLLQRLWPAPLRSAGVGGFFSSYACL